MGFIYFWFGPMCIQRRRGLTKALDKISATLLQICKACIYMLLIPVVRDQIHTHDLRETINQAHTTQSTTHKFMWFEKLAKSTENSHQFTIPGDHHTRRTTLFSYKQEYKRSLSLLISVRQSQSLSLIVQCFHHLG